MMQRMTPILMMVALAALLLAAGCNAAAPSGDDPERRAQGFHCLDSWDGHHPGFERLVKAQLKDPSSMKTAWTKVGRVSGGRHAIIMEFTATNSFGGRVTQIADGSFSNSTCTATLTGIN